jgi:hypothetical protein
VRPWFSDVGFRVEGFLKPFNLSAEKLFKVGLRFDQNWPAGYNNGFLKLSLLIFEAEQNLPEGRRVCPCPFRKFHPAWIRIVCNLVCKLSSDSPRSVDAGSRGDR